MPSARPRLVWKDAWMRLASSRRDAEDRLSPIATIVGGLVLAAWPLAIALVRHDGAAVGADTPVYVWWTRLVGAAGGSTVAFRPGVPDVTAVVAATLGVPATTAVAALGCVCVVLAGMSGAAVMRAAGQGGWTPLVALALTGMFSVYLGSGHLSNAVFVALFFLSFAFLLDDERRGVAEAALLLGAAGLAHPAFLVLAAVILVGAAALALIASQRGEAAATGLALAGGLGVTAMGLVGARIGGPAFDVPTSLDVFLQQTGQFARLRALFLERFPKVAGYALWAWLPLAACAVTRLRSRLGRLLVAWAAFTAVGVVVGLVRQPFPPHRVVAFAFCLPLLASLGLDTVAARLGRAAPAATVAILLAVGASATIAWLGAPRPFDDPFVQIAQAAGERIATTPGGPVVVDLPRDANLTAVAVIRATNLLRAAAPPQRARDLLVRFALPAASHPDSESLWRSSQDQVRAAVGSMAVSELPLANTTGLPSAEALDPDAVVTMLAPVGAPPSPAPPSVAGLAAAVVGWLALCGVAGGGWCVALGLRGTRLVERAIGAGFAALVLVGAAADAAGLRLGGRPAATGVVVVAAGAGWVLAFGTRRRADRRAAERAGACTTAGGRDRISSIEGPRTR